MVAGEGDIRTFNKEKGCGFTIGFGSRPTVLPIDFMSAFTDESMPLGANFNAEIEAAL